MRIRGDIESVNLRTGERMQRVTGDGESTLEPMDTILREALEATKEIRERERAGEFVGQDVMEFRMR
jgi:hypothetical protein